jgi:group II intron reverse transcriptase/maturase
MLPKAQKYLEVVRKRGEVNAEINRVYRMLYCEELYLMAYAKLYANKGAMTPGTAPNDTVDGMSLERINVLIEKLKRQEYEWKPVRRTYILKRDRVNKRALGMPGWNDKMLQEVMRMILEAYYEPQFRESSHGFRPQRGCHTALDTIKTWKGTRWFIEGDIKGCFDGIQHHVVLRILKRKIKDKLFLKLIEDMLKAGYMEDMTYHQTYSGTPQGGIISPLLMNIVLNELDTFVEDMLIPKYTKGTKRKENPAYGRLHRRIKWLEKKGEWKRANELRKLYVKMPSLLQNDPNFRRLWYVRYADDTLLGLIGTKKDAETIKEEFGRFLHSIELEMSAEKTLITHAKTGKARFLNYEINRMSGQTKKKAIWNGKRESERRIATYALWFAIPKDVTDTWKARVEKNGKVRHRAELMNLSDYDIIRTYEVELQGLINYYCRAHNQKRLRYVRYLWETSLTKTLASKHKTNVTTIIKRYRRYTADGRRVVSVEIPREGKESLQATFGKKPIQRNNAVIEEKKHVVYITRNQLITRLLANECELCGNVNTALIGHHVKKLKDLKKRWEGRKEKPTWVKKMIAIRRKVLFVCPSCHNDIHSGKYDGGKLT